jgi:hypothetical protein
VDEKQVVKLFRRGILGGKKNTESQMALNNKKNCQVPFLSQTTKRACMLGG